jgi:hypothetical protein
MDFTVFYWTEKWPRSIVLHGLLEVYLAPILDDFRTLAENDFNFFAVQDLLTTI